jgi:hypothetical protein
MLYGNQCRPGGDRGVFVGFREKPGCGLTDLNARFLVTSRGGTNFTGDVASVAGCMLKLGCAGCSQQHSLQSLRVGLDEGLTPENKGFLRPDALLAIVLLTDEDDCSAPPDTDLFALDYPGFLSSWRCAYHGHLCGGRMPPMAEFSAPYASCTSNEGGKLIPVKQIADSVRALKPRPDRQILVAAIAGIPDSADPVYRYTRYPDGQIDYGKICTGPHWGATGAIRIKTFVDAFDGTMYSICPDDYRPALAKIGEAIAARLR